MKKTSLSIIALLMSACFLLFSGCQGKEEATPAAETAEEFWARPHNWQSDKHMNMQGSSSDYGYYYVDNDSILKYLDYTTKQSVALCNKVGCKHDDWTCEAFSTDGSPSMFFRDEKMYLITEIYDGTRHIFCCDLDASNREDKIMLTKDELEKGNAVQIDEYVVNGDDLYYKAVFRESTDEAGGEKKLPIHAIRHVDMKNWTEEEVCRSVEYDYMLISADEEGVLICKVPDSNVFTKVDVDSLTQEELEKGVLLLSLDELKKLPLDALYWDKKTGDMLTVYQGNAKDTVIFPMADGSFLYRLARTDDAEGMALEKINMQTGETEWLWKEKNGKGTSLFGCVANNGYLWLGAMTVDGKGKDELYIQDGFKEVPLPALKPNDFISFLDDRGLFVHRVEKFKGEGEEGDVAKEIFIFMDEVGKEEADYVVLMSWGQD